MSVSIPSPEASPAQRHAAASPDGGPDAAGGLAILRAELDRIDDALHDLLMQRAAVVERVAATRKPAAFRPGREAAIIRRLLSRHHGSLPRVTIVRLWRELLAGTTSMQGRFFVAIPDNAPDAPLGQLAREHFGALTPLRTCHGAEAALADVSQGGAPVAVLPYPSDTATWWVSLLHQKPRLHIIGRLPFWRPRPDGAAAVQAVMVGAVPADPSGDDCSFLGLECEAGFSRARLSSELAAAGLQSQAIALSQAPGAPATQALIELPGFLTDDDSRLAALSGALRRPAILGTFAMPVGAIAP
jgi:chorismate mutase/prephenate dehydratase